MAQRPSAAGALYRSLLRIADSAVGRTERALLARLGRVSAFTTRRGASADRVALGAALQTRDPLAVQRALGISGPEAAQVQQALGSVYARSAQATAALGGAHISATLDVPFPTALSYARRQSSTLVTGISAEQRAFLQGVISQGFSKGLTIADMAKRIRERIGLSPQMHDWVDAYRERLEATEAPNVDDKVQRYTDKLRRYRARMIARTETIRASAAGQDALWQAEVKQGQLNPATVRRVWSVIPDEVTCKICGGIPRLNPDGRAIGEPFRLPGGGVAMHPPAHPNCLPEGSLITASPRITGAMKRWYEGDLVVIRTAVGQQLACTPNHPILTPTGWMAAHLLHVGGHVIRQCSGDRVSLRDDDHQYVPARIEEIADAFRCAPGVSAREMPISAEDFHADGKGSEVAVVWANGELRNAGNSTLDQEIFEFTLHCAHALTRLSGDSTSAELIYAALSPSHGFMGGSDLPFALCPGHALPLETFGFGLSSYDDAGLLQASLNASPGDDERARQLQDGFAGPVALDQVADVDVRAFRGHVYNLETVGGYYLVSGIIVSNCRCTVTLVDRAKGVGLHYQKFKETTPPTRAPALPAVAPPVPAPAPSPVPAVTPERQPPPVTVPIGWPPGVDPGDYSYLDAALQPLAQRALASMSPPSEWARLRGYQHRYGERSDADYGALTGLEGLGRLRDRRPIEALTETMADFAAEADSLGVPRLRGIKVIDPTDPSTGELTETASMGDGVLAINPVAISVMAHAAEHPPPDPRVALLDELRVTAARASRKSQRRWRRELRQDIAELEASLRAEPAGTQAVAASPWQPGDDPALRPHNVSGYVDTARDVVRAELYHEFGHHVHQQFATQGTNDRLTPVEARLRRLEDVIAGRSGTPAEQAAVRGATQYAHANGHEWFAEHYALMRLGRDDLLPQAFTQLWADIEAHVAAHPPGSAGYVIGTPHSPSRVLPSSEGMTAHPQAMATAARRILLKQRPESPALDIQEAKVAYAVTEVQGRVWKGEPPARRFKTKFASKAEQGGIAEDIIVSYLRSKGIDARHLHAKASTAYATDLVAGNELIEAKGGLGDLPVKNAHWRLTFSSITKEDEAKMAKLKTPEERRAFRAQIQARTLDRKYDSLRDVSKELGRTLVPTTYTLIMNPDTNTADVFRFKGWHQTIRFNSDMAREAYVTTITYVPLSQREPKTGRGA